MTSHRAFFLPALILTMLTAASARAAIICRNSDAIATGGMSWHDAVRYDVDADGLTDFVLSIQFLQTDDVPSSGQVFITYFTPRSGFEFLKTIDPSFPQLLALVGSVEIGPIPGAGQWNQGRTSSPSIVYATQLYSPSENGYAGTFRGLDEVWIGYRLARDGETFYGALALDLMPDASTLTLGPSILASYNETGPNTAINTTSVPEPCSTALIACGLIAASVRRRVIRSRAGTAC